jgi:hypothetical protein
MARDVAANICRRYSGLAAECRNQHVVQVALTDDREAIQEKKIDHLTGFVIWQLDAVRANLLPHGNHLADDWIDGLGEGCARFVHGDIEHANRAAA